MPVIGIALGIVVVAAILLWIFVFRWDPKRKPWCVIFYLVAQVPDSADVQVPDYETGARTPGQTLDEQLDLVVSTIRLLPCATNAQIVANPVWDNVYVVYRAIWDEAHTPEARVVRPELSAPVTDYFPGETPYDISLSVDLSTDIKKFFSWAYDKCPADQYAVFFWGHAMGPGGLFHQSEPPVVVAPPVKFVLHFLKWFIGTNRWSGAIGLEGLRRAAQQIVEKRIARQTETHATLPPSRSIPGGFSSLPPTIPPSSGTVPQPPALPALAVPKVEIVLFQDCWMSGLETAFQVQNVVRYIIASQSLVPIGLNPVAGQPGVTWPYEKLIDALLTDANYPTKMLAILKGFFDAGGNNIYPAKKALFSLLDCRTETDWVSSKVAQKFVDLVKALNPLGPAGRSKLIDQADGAAGRLYEISGGTLQVGDQALIDVLTMCGYLANPALWPPSLVVGQQDKTAITTAAGALQPAVASLITDTFQSPAYVPGDPTYRGITALYKTWAIWGDDPFIENTVRSPYDNLSFAQKTVYIALSTGVDEVSWAQYAFEKYPWI